MSMRSDINRKKRALDLIACAGFAIFFGAITYSFYGIKCLKCHGPFGYVVVAMGT